MEESPKKVKQEISKEGKSNENYLNRIEIYW
jgi:hypothetical protein